MGSKSAPHGAAACQCAEARLVVGCSCPCHRAPTPAERAEFKRAEFARVADLTEAAMVRSEAKHIHEGRWCRDCLAPVNEMREYARHLPSCAYEPIYPDAPIATCTCGFDAVLERYDRLAADG